MTKYNERLEKLLNQMARDEKIRELRRMGVRPQEIARQVGISRQRVGVISSDVPHAGRGRPRKEKGAA